MPWALAWGLVWAGEIWCRVYGRCCKLLEERILRVVVGIPVRLNEVTVSGYMTQTREYFLIVRFPSGTILVGRGDKC